MYVLVQAQFYTNTLVTKIILLNTSFMRRKEFPVVKVMLVLELTSRAAPSTTILVSMISDWIDLLF